MANNLVHSVDKSIHCCSGMGLRHGAFGLLKKKTWIPHPVSTIWIWWSMQTSQQKLSLFGACRFLCILTFYDVMFFFLREHLQVFWLAWPSWTAQSWSWKGCAVDTGDCLVLIFTHPPLLHAFTNVDTALYPVFFTPRFLMPGPDWFVQKVLMFMFAFLC